MVLLEAQSGSSDWCNLSDLVDFAPFMVVVLAPRSIIVRFVGLTFIALIYFGAFLTLRVEWQVSPAFAWGMIGNLSIGELVIGLV